MEKTIIEKEYEKVRTACIEAYKQILNDKMALDFCKVQGAMRHKILKDAVYIVETKAIRASSYIDELKVIQGVESGLTGNTIDTDDSPYGSSADASALNERDRVTLLLKSQELKREIMRKTAEDTLDNESEILNFCYTPLSDAEFKEMVQTEVFGNRGEANSEEAFDNLIEEENTELKGSGEDTEGDSLVITEADRKRGYIILPDGSIRGISDES